MIPHGLSLLEARHIAEELGIEVSQRRRTGEWVFRVAGQPVVVVNSRRKDASRMVVLLLRKVQAAKETA